MLTFNRTVPTAVNAVKLARLVKFVPKEPAKFLAKLGLPTGVEIVSISRPTSKTVANAPIPVQRAKFALVVNAKFLAKMASQIAMEVA